MHARPRAAGRAASAAARVAALAVSGARISAAPSGEQPAAAAHGRPLGSSYETIITRGDEAAALSAKSWPMAYVSADVMLV